MSSWHDLVIDKDPESSANHGEQKRPARDGEEIDPAGAHCRDLAVSRHSREDQNGRHQQRDGDGPLHRLGKAHKREARDEIDRDPLKHIPNDLDHQPDSQHERQHQERQEEGCQEGPEDIALDRLHSPPPPKFHWRPTTAEYNIPHGESMPSMARASKRRSRDSVKW